MRRLAVSRAVAVALVALLMGVVLAGHATTSDAQSATPGAMAGHPLVGSWVNTAPGGAPAVTAFTSDGIIIDAEAEGSTGVGSWQPTGPRTAAFTIVVQTQLPAQHFVGTAVIRGTLTVNAAGDAFTAPNSYTVVALDGRVVAKGSNTVTGKRLPVEPESAVGTPLAGYPTVVGTPPS